VVAQENDEPERVGRDQWMRARQDMEKKLKRFNAKVLANAANGDRLLLGVGIRHGCGGDGADEDDPGEALERRKVRQRFYHE
jgi:hypothetical protein